MSKIKRGTEISFPVLIPLLLSPPFLLPLPFPQPLLFLLGRWFDGVAISGLEVSNFGPCRRSVAQTFVVSLQHGGHRLFGPDSLWSQPRPGFPATAHHHLVAVAGGGETVVRGGSGAPQTELMQRGREMRGRAAVVVTATHTAPLRLGGAEGKHKGR